MPAAASIPIIVIVGAGSVGQVLGHHLQRAGARVVFFVRAKYKESAGHFELHTLPSRGETGIAAAGFGIITTAAELAELDANELHITLPSPLAGGAWLRELVAAAPNATVVAYPPGPDDKALLIECDVPEAQLVMGLIGFIAYAAPLAGEPWVSAGTAYWFPPLSPSLYLGSGDRAQAVTANLRRGGLPARVIADVSRSGAMPAAILAAYLTALECADWSLRAFVRGPMLVHGAAAAREAAQIASASAQLPLLAALLTRATIMQIALFFAQLMMPFSLEDYLKKHFSKVLTQTRSLVEGLCARAPSHGLHATELAALHQQALQRAATG